MKVITHNLMVVRQLIFLYSKNDPFFPIRVR